MQLRFELGDPDHPRGHAILYARLGNDASRVVATYCVALPIQFSIGKFLPPILSGQFPTEGLQEAATMSVVPIPPMLEDVPALAALRQMAQRRDDDLCDMGAIFLTSDQQRMAYAAEGCQAYGQLFAEYLESWPQLAASGGGGSAAETPAVESEIDVDEVMTGLLSERDRVAELARLIGQARYALEGSDRRLLDEVSRAMRRIAHSLPEKYRAEQLVAAALSADAAGAQLAGLYLQRAYKLVEEDYASIPPIEEQIRALRAPAGGSDGPPSD
ncbi:MAG: hypothetical protein ACHQ4H_12585 [Ktedonobacterales bacterium]